MEIESRFKCLFACLMSLLRTLEQAVYTVIAKTQRIYHIDIFKIFGRVSRACSNQVLFIIILGIVSGKIIILIVYANSDATHVVDMEQLVSQGIPPFIQVIQECQSKHHQILLTGYSMILGLVMVLHAHCP